MMSIKSGIGNLKIVVFLRKIGEKIAAIVNFILLLFVYFVGVGFSALIAKIHKKHFLDLNFQDRSKWIKKAKKREANAHYRMF